LKIALLYALPPSLALTILILIAVLIHVRCQRQPQCNNSAKPELGVIEGQEIVPLAAGDEGLGVEDEGLGLANEIYEEIEALDNALRGAVDNESD